MVKLPQPHGAAVHKGEVLEYTESQLKQAVRDAYEDAAKVATTTCHYEATFFANKFNQTMLNIKTNIHAPIEEIPE